MDVIHYQDIIMEDPRCGCHSLTGNIIQIQTKLLELIENKRFRAFVPCFKLTCFGMLKSSENKKL